MNRKGIRTAQVVRERGQVVLEYALATTIVAALGAGLFLSYQGFVYGNLYGSAGEYNEGVYLLPKEHKSMGLERVVSLPMP